MRIYRLLILLTCIFLLSACDDSKKIIKLNEKIATLSKECIRVSASNSELSAANSENVLKIQTDYAKRMFELEKQRIAAAITHACKEPFNFNVCPESVTAAGEIAIKNGVSGGDRLLFWLPYSLKIICFILILFLPTLIGFKIWSRRFKPLFDSVKDAKNFLTETETKSYDLDKLIAVRTTVLNQISETINHQEKIFNENKMELEDDLNVMREEIESNRQFIAAQESEMKSRKAALDVLSAFKI